MIFKGNIAERRSQILTLSCSLKYVIFFLFFLVSWRNQTPSSSQRETEKGSLLSILTPTGTPKQSIVWPFGRGVSHRPN